MRANRAWLGLCVAIPFGQAAVRGESPAPVPVGEARVVRPGDLVERVIGLFKGSKAAHPAAALAAWRNGGGAGLGKPLEALIASMNPAMVPELAPLDGSHFRVETVDGAVNWRLVVPGDDGRFGGLAEALALTDGAVLEPLGGRPVFRVGPEGSAVALGPPGPLVVASELVGLNEPKAASSPPEIRPPGLYAGLDPAGLRAVSGLNARRLGEALGALGATSVSAGLVVDGDAIAFDARTSLEAPAFTEAVDPAWLEAPADGRRLAIFAVVLDGRKGAIDRAFAVGDRVDRVGPAREGIAPLRSRLNLLALAARVNPEVDLWPKLRGASGWVASGPDGLPSAAKLLLHAESPEAADRIVVAVLPRLFATYFREGKAAEGDVPAGARRLGTIEGRPLVAGRSGPSAWVLWGEPLPSGPVGPNLQEALSGGPVQRLGLFWPGALLTAADPLAGALAEAPPVVWTGRADGPAALDTFRWEGLRAPLRRWLDALPLVAPPDRSTDR